MKQHARPAVPSGFADPMLNPSRRNSNPLKVDLPNPLICGELNSTETFGVKALAAELSKRFRVPWTFLDHPTGL